MTNQFLGALKLKCTHPLRRYVDAMLAELKAERVGMPADMEISGRLFGKVLIKFNHRLMSYRAGYSNHYKTRLKIVKLPKGKYAAYSLRYDSCAYFSTKGWEASERIFCDNKSGETAVPLNGLKEVLRLAIANAKYHQHEFEKYAPGKAKIQIANLGS